MIKTDCGKADCEHYEDGYCNRFEPTCSKSTKIVGYARVSSKDQNLDRQIDNLNKIRVDKLFLEKQSGKDFASREVYQFMKNCLHKGDTLVIASIDRLGRNYDEILVEWQELTNRGVEMQVLDMPMLNTKNGVNGLDGKFLSNLVLQVLAYVAQKEREKIKERQAEGIKVAKEKGVRFGRPSKIDKKAFAESVYAESREQTMRRFGISRGTYFLYKKRICKPQKQFLQ